MSALRIVVGLPEVSVQPVHVQACGGMATLEVDLRPGDYLSVRGHGVTSFRALLEAAPPKSPTSATPARVDWLHPVNKPTTPVDVDIFRSAGAPELRDLYADPFGSFFECSRSESKFILLLVKT